MRLLVFSMVSLVVILVLSFTVGCGGEVGDCGERDDRGSGDCG